jgi:L-Ala-D/L-Glu epimerase
MLRSVLSRTQVIEGFDATTRRFELREPFSITRFTVDAIEPLWVSLHATYRTVGAASAAVARGRGEGNRVDYDGETGESMTAQLQHTLRQLGPTLSLQSIDDALAPGAARNALSCALLDLHAKVSGVAAWRLLGLPEPRPVQTCNTLGLATAAAMAAQARALAAYPLLKVKLGRHVDDAARIEAVRRARPDATLMVDANAGWTLDEFRDLLPTLQRAGVVLVEQPVAPGADAELASVASPLPVAADESVSDAASLARLPAGYSHVNIKLDKCGGLPEALRLAAAARQGGWRLMVGNMMGSSLGMASAFLLAPWADWIDLDGPIDLVADCDNGFDYHHAQMPPPSPALWG